MGDGFRIAQKRLGPGRIHHVMRWLGQMQRAFELMCTYALEREAFGGPLAEKQTVQNWIADSAAEIQACRLLTLDAAHKIDQGSEARVEVSVIKFYAARVLNDVIDRAVQVHGARGLTDETPLAPMLAMARGGPDLRRPGRGAPHGRRPADPQVVRRRRRLALRVRRRSGLRRPLRPRCRNAGAAAVIVLAAVASPSAAGSALARFDRNGIAFEHPSSWFVTTRPLSNAVNPTYRFTVSDVRVRRTRDDDGPCLPGVARQLPATAVLAYLREAVGSERAPSLPRMQPRPRSFRLPTRADSSLCGFDRGGRWVPFKTSGRAFYLGVYVGPTASASKVRTLQRLLDGMRIDPA